jgi:hypothetical protein
VRSDVRNTPLVFDLQDSDTIYAIDTSTSNDGVFKSTGCTSWNPAKSGIPSFRQVIALAIDPLKPSMHAGTSEGTFKSTDGGTHWSPANSGLPLYYPARLLIHVMRYARPVCTPLSSIRKTQARCTRLPMASQLIPPRA